MKNTGYLRREIKSTLVSSGTNPVHIGVILEQLLLEKMFVIDIKYILDYLVFPGANHILLFNSLIKISLFVLNYQTW